MTKVKVSKRQQKANKSLDYGYNEHPQPKPQSDIALNVSFLKKTK